MPSVPAACMTCGAVFWMRLPFGGLGTVDLKSNLTNCTTCGGWAQVADGVFQFTRDGMAVISAPDVTHEMLAALRVVLKRAHERNLPVEEIKRQAEEISPAFGGLFTPTDWSPAVKAALIMLLTAIIVALINLRQEPTTVNVENIDVSKLIDALVQMPADRVVRGDADEVIAKTVKPRIIGPPKLKPGNATPPGQGPKRGKRRSRQRPPRKPR